MPQLLERSPFKRAVTDGLTVASSTASTAQGSRANKGSAWVDLFLCAIMRGCSIVDAANEAGIHFTLPYQRRMTHEDFRRAWKDAADIGTEFLEQEAARRAYHGVLRPVFYKGEECGQERIYSDNLLMFLLKGRKPEMYREGIEDNLLHPHGNLVLNVQVVNVDSKPEPIVVIPQEVDGAAVLVEVV